MARRRKSKQSNDIVKYSVIGVAVLATLMLIINFAPTGQFYNLQTYDAYGYNAYNEDPADFALDTFFEFSAMLIGPPSDHDGDGAYDYRECPNLFLDSDSDGIEDIVETIQTGTDPNNADTDRDGYLDGVDSHPLDETLPIPPTVAPVNPKPGDGLGDGKQIPGFGSGSGLRTQINNLLTGAFITGSAFHGGGLGPIVIVRGPTSDFTYDPVAPTVGEVITFDASKSNTELMKKVCSNSAYKDETMCTLMGTCTTFGELSFPPTSTETDEMRCGDGSKWVGYAWGKPTIVNYEWNLGNVLVNGEDSSATHNYNTEGDFDVTLTVEASNGLKGVSTQTLTVVTPTAVMQPPTGIGATVTDPDPEGIRVLDWITDKTLAGNFRNCPDNPLDIKKGNGVPDIIDRGSDIDGDGWTDYYEFMTRGDSEAVDDPPPEDRDNDGFNDKEEAESGSDPGSPTSIPKFTGEGETSLIVSNDVTNKQCSLLIRPAETRSALAILKITDAGKVTGFVYQTRALESGIAQTLTIDKPSTGALCEGFLWEDWSGTSLADKVEISL